MVSVDGRLCHDYYNAFLAEHMRLFGDVVDQYQTQQMFYTFLDPEVATCQTGFQLLKSPALAHKLHKRKFTKFCNYYLLDKLELNTKARCVFCWAGNELCVFDRRV